MYYPFTKMILVLQKDINFFKVIIMKLKCGWVTMNSMINFTVIPQKKFFCSVIIQKIIFGTNFWAKSEWQIFL